MLYKKFDKTLKSPSYSTDGAAGIDLYVGRDIEVLPGVVTLVPLNIAVQIPENHVGLLLVRSSIPGKLKISLANGVGIIDSDYSGNEDEILAAMVTLVDVSVNLRRGDKIAQLVIVPYVKVKLEEEDTLPGPNRGGFGTTG